MDIKQTDEYNIDNAISELPWEAQKRTTGNGDNEKVIADIWGAEIGERITANAYEKNADYIIGCCNIFPELVYQLEILNNNSKLLKQAKEILNQAGIRSSSYSYIEYIKD